MMKKINAQKLKIAGSLIFKRPSSSMAPTVKSDRVGAHDFVFLPVTDILSSSNRRCHVREISIPVRIIGGEEQRVLSYALHNIRQSAFFRFRGVKPVAGRHIFAWLFLQQRRL